MSATILRGHGLHAPPSTDDQAVAAIVVALEDSVDNKFGEGDKAAAQILARFSGVNRTIIIGRALAAGASFSYLKRAADSIGEVIDNPGGFGPAPSSGVIVAAASDWPFGLTPTRLVIGLVAIFGAWYLYQAHMQQRKA